MSEVNILTIDPRLRRVENKMVDIDALNQFARGWINHNLDHATIMVHEGRRYMIIVYGLGLVGGPDTSKFYFALGRQLFNGRAIIYCANYKGETIAVPRTLAAHWNNQDCEDFNWVGSANAAEKLMTTGRLDRPQTEVNGEVVWQWSTPPDFKAWEDTMTKIARAAVEGLDQ